MKRILIAYDTTEGQSRTIAQHVVDAIARSGKEVQVIDIRRPLTGFTLDGYEYMDWAAVDRFVSGFLVHLEKREKA